MRIKKISFPLRITEDIGLDKIEMKDLGKIVIIAGKNGAGKSRLLKLIKENELLVQTKFSAEKERNRKNLDDTRKALRQLTLTINDYEEKGLNNLSNSDKEDHKISLLKKNQLEQDIINLENDLKIEVLEFEDGLPKSEIFEFIPKKVELTTPDNLTKKELKDSLLSESKIRIDNLSERACGKIQALQDFSIGNPQNISFSESEAILRNEYTEKYKRIEGMIMQFLNTELGRDIFGDTLIFKKPFIDANLSEGQRVLLQLCVALNENEISLQDAILVLDEPENHLHPKILIDVLEKVMTLNTKGQIWIATHSIPLIAHFDPSSLWLMEDNKVYFAGRQPDKIIDNLVGDNEKEKLTEFLNLPAVFASTKFASECLSPPQVVDTSIMDPQTNQINEVLLGLSENASKLTVLDFGAGKGRLLKLLLHLKEANSSENSYEYLDYYACDLPTINEEIKNECINVIQSFYRKIDKKKRYFTGTHEMYFETDYFFDVVVLCNVLHEIDPTEWIRTFSSEEIILKHLKPDGYVLIVEDQQMPVGERAYKNGFMVFGENQFRKLFNIKSNDNYIVNDARGDSRLLAHLIPKNKIQTITNGSIYRSIKSLQQDALEKIRSIRNNAKSDFKTGMKLSFWLNQYANASLNIQNFKKDG